MDVTTMLVAARSNGSDVVPRIGWRCLGSAIERNLESMSSPRISMSRRSVAGLSLIGLSLVGCGSSGGDDPLDDGDPSTPVDQGTVVPPDGQGVGGGEPVDNLNDGESQQPAQGGGDSDLESNNGG